ncbi:hypothetical protein ACTXQV_79285, partial [Klebsiella pneumoniae]
MAAGLKGGGDKSLAGGGDILLAATHLISGCKTSSRFPNRRSSRQVVTGAHTRGWFVGRKRRRARKQTEQAL